MLRGESTPDGPPSDPSYACEALAAGEAVVVPNPPPITYSLVATTARAINVVKGRPLEQTVAVSLHDPGERRRVARCIELSEAAMTGAMRLLDQRLSVLLPVRARTKLPAWVRPALEGEYLAVFNGRWAKTNAVWDRFPRLYGSSANKTGQPPAGSAAEARAYFGITCRVVEAEETFTGPTHPRAHSTMVRLDRHGRLSMHRSGAQDQASGLDARAFLGRLAESVGADAHLSTLLAGGGSEESW